MWRNASLRTFTFCGRQLAREESGFHWLADYGGPSAPATRADMHAANTI